MSDVPPMVSCVVVAVTVNAESVGDDAVHFGVAPHVLPKLMTQEVRTPVPPVTLPNVSLPPTVGLVPQLEFVGAEAAPDASR